MSSFNIFMHFLVNPLNSILSNKIFLFFLFFSLNPNPPATGNRDLTTDPNVPGNVTKILLNYYQK